MPSTPRRQFLQTVGAVGLATWMTPALADDRLPGTLMPTRGALRKVPLPQNDKTGRFRPPTRLGVGGLAIGNAFAAATNKQCAETLEVAWASGVRYFDTSPWYGL